MKLSAPKQITFIVAVALAALAALSSQMAIPIVSGNAFITLGIAFVLLAAANLVREL